jgi:hypothetical protein
MNASPLFYALLMLGPTPAQESTQMANNALLGAKNVAEEAKIPAWLQHLKDQTEKLGAFVTELAEVRQQLAYLQQLAKSLHPDAIKQLFLDELGVSSIEEAARYASDVDRLLGQAALLQGDLQILIREGTIAEDALNRLREQGYEISDNDYIEAMKAMASERHSQYAQRMEVFREALTRARDGAAKLEKQVQTVSATQGALESAQTLAASLQELNLTLKETQIVAATRGQTMVEAANALDQLLIMREQRARAMGSFWAGGSFRDSKAANAKPPSNGNSPPNNGNPPPNNNPPPPP